MFFVELDTPYGKRVVNTERIVFIKPPFEGRDHYTVYFDIFEYDDDDHIDYFHMLVKSPSYKELMDILNERSNKTNNILDRIQKTIIRRGK